MTDPWQRAAGDRHVVEIELTDAHAGSRPRAAAAPLTDGAAPRSPRRARTVTLLAVGAVAAAGVVAATATGDDDSPSGDEATSTTIDATLITTPPTLSPITLPPVTVTTAAGPDDDGDDDGSGATPDGSPSVTVDPSTVTVPTFETLPLPTGDGELAAFDLLAAAAANRPGGTPIGTFLRLQAVQDGGRLYVETAVEVANDGAGLDSMTITGNARDTARLVVDRTSGIVYRTFDGFDGSWERFPSSDFTDDTGTDDIGTLFDTFVTGPITPATLAASTVTSDDHLVQLPDGILARRYQVTTPVEALRPFGLLLFANIFDSSVQAGLTPDQIVFDVYVTDHPALVLVTTSFAENGITFVLQQTFDQRPADVVIEVPPDELVVGSETTSPASPTSVPVGTPTSVATG